MSLQSVMVIGSQNLWNQFFVMTASSYRHHNVIIRMTKKPDVAALFPSVDKFVFVNSAKIEPTVVVPNHNNPDVVFGLERTMYRLDP